MISSAPPIAPVTLFVGRQPIFDRSLDTVAYELLFRSGADAVTADVIDGGAATARVLVSAVTEIGLNNLVGAKQAFVNITEHFITRPHLLAALPPDRVVLEVLETVPPTDAVIAGLTELASQGYTLAMDDFMWGPMFERVLPLVQIIKYDYSDISGLRLRRRISEDHRAGRKVVVERIETHLEHRDAELAGADYFQGYFFAKPKTVSVQAVPPSRLMLLQLLARVNDPEATTEEIVSLLTQDVGMSVKTLRYVNSAGSGMKHTIDSIERAAILLGRDQLRSCTSLSLMAAMPDQPGEVLGLALWRAKACENVARTYERANPSSYYAVGMLSLLDVITGAPMETILKDLSVNDEIRACLLGEPNQLREVLDQVIELERADTPDPDVPAAVLDAHQRAMVWANSLVLSADGT
jgi:EAL and modified HD-GYP domain-containing signal transduction protein